jgi:tRNA (uracil-5-)-methyltransferase TRM9
MWVAMNAQTAQALNKMNAKFYAALASEFSATRQSKWQGWERVAGLLREVFGEDLAREVCGEGALSCVNVASVSAAGLANNRMGEKTRDVVEAAKHLSCVDVACGNLRFQKFLLESFPNASFDFLCLDNCESLKAEGYFGEISKNARANLQFSQCDIVTCLLDDAPLPMRKEQAQLVSSFGFMHHIPGFSARAAFLRQLFETAAPGGLIVVSLWRFMNDPKLAKKAHTSHEKALVALQKELCCSTNGGSAFCDITSDANALDVSALATSALDLDKNDYLLGWQEQGEYFRYCHYFDNEEIEALIATALDTGLVSLQDRFDADGRTEALNTYLVFRRK